ncbi:MAG: hypothetical protein ACRCX2_21775 [Paraclostridium sp.]
MGKKIEVRVSDEFKVKAEKLSKLKGVTISEIIRKNLEKEMKKHKI